MNIGKQLRQIRKEKGLTQKELANMIGCSEITIRQYETGKRVPRDEIKRKLAKALEVKVMELVDYLTEDETLEEPVKQAEKNVIKKDNDWFKTQIHRMIELLDDNKKLHIIWTIVKCYIKKQWEETI